MKFKIIVRCIRHRHGANVIPVANSAQSMFAKLTKLTMESKDSSNNRSQEGMKEFTFDSDDAQEIYNKIGEFQARANSCNPEFQKKCVTYKHAKDEIFTAFGLENCKVNDIADKAIRSVVSKSLSKEAFKYWDYDIKIVEQKDDGLELLCSAPRIHSLRELSFRDFVRSDDFTKYQVPDKLKTKTKSKAEAKGEQQNSTPENGEQ